MEVKKGYKQTELGVIPEDWDVKLLSEVVDFLDGKRKPIKSSERNSGEFPYYGASGIIDYVNDYIFDDALILLGEDGENILSRNLPLAFKVKGKIWVNNHAHVLKPLVGNDITYLTDYLESLDYSLLNSGTAQPKLNKQACLNIKIACPPLPEQTAIATALSDMDALIAQTEKLIEKKKAMKQGMLQELLKPKKGWVTKKLGEIGFTYGGITGKSKIDFEHGESKFIPFLNVLNNTILDTDYLQNVDIKPNEIQNRVQRGDLFFNGSSETPEDLGLCSVLDKELEYVYLNSFCFGFRFYNSSISGKFLAYFFRSHFGRRSIFSLAQGATRYNLSKTNFLKLEIPLPDKNEQDNIVSVLIDIDDSISINKSKLHKLKLQKQGMMQELLTGRIRLL